MDEPLLDEYSSDPDELLNILQVALKKRVIRTEPNIVSDFVQVMTKDQIQLLYYNRCLDLQIPYKEK